MRQIVLVLLVLLKVGLVGLVRVILREVPHQISFLAVKESVVEMVKEGLLNCLEGFPHMHVVALLR